MPRRLYYDDPYLTEFDASVEAARRDADGCRVLLDRTAFYPTSGGQPFDTGFLSRGNDRFAVTDVLVDGGEVWHRIDGVLMPGDAVHGSIDRGRRFDHMQQHAGDHLLAGAIWRSLRGVTLGLHIGKQDSSIDVELPGGRTHLTGEELAFLETDVNEHIQRDLPIRCWFPDEAELKALPLRKQPEAYEHIRIVAMGDDEMVPCGGTHPARTGEIGLLKILHAAPARGKLRVTFLAGMRALEHYRLLASASSRAAELLSCPVAELPQSTAAALEKIAGLEGRCTALLRADALARAKQAAEEAETLPDGTRLVVLELSDGGMDALQGAASLLTRDPRCAALLSLPAQDGLLLLFARGADVPADMAALLRQSGARGGGRPDFARGSTPDPGLPQAAARLLRSLLPAGPAGSPEPPRDI